METVASGCVCFGEGNMSLATAKVSGYKRVKTRKCKECRSEFQPSRIGQKVCSPACAQRLAEKHREKVTRKETRSKLLALKPLSHFEKIAERAVNRYVRLRDRNEGCCSCDKTATWGGQWHASHLKSVGANSALRFNLWNINKSCSICNNHRSGNIAEYRKWYSERFGQDRLDWLDNQPKTKRYTREYLIRLAKVFNKRCRMIEKREAA